MENTKPYQKHQKIGAGTLYRMTRAIMPPWTGRSGSIAASRRERWSYTWREHPQVDHLILEVTRDRSGQQDLEKATCASSHSLRTSP